MEIKDKYEKEMYDFLTHPENFENMMKVMELKDMVRENLIVEFWELVIKKMESLNESAGKKWLVLGPKNKEAFFEKHATINLIKPEWEDEKKVSPMGVAWQAISTSFYYGIWAEPESNRIDSLRVREHFKKLDMAGFKSDQWWPMFAHSGYHFQNLKDLEHILPDRRDDLAEEYANLVFDLAEKREKDLDLAITMKPNK